MPTVSQNLAQIRALLNEPSSQQPSDRVLFEILSNQIIHHQSQLQNSATNWAVYTWQLTAVQGQEDYLITAEDFGKPFLVYWDDPNDTYRPRVEVPFAMLQNADMFYNGPRQVYSDSSTYPTVSTISFFRQSDGWYARLTPIPGGTATYTIMYEVTPKAPQSLGDSPGLSPFHHLIRAQTALAALPYCGWGAVRVDSSDRAMAAAWERQTTALATALGVQVAQFQKEFSTYIGSLMQAGVERRSGFGDGYADGGDIGGVGYFGPNSF